MTTGESKPSNVAIAALTVDADHGATQVNLVDTGGSKNLASRHLLKNIKLAKSYGNEPIRMVTVNDLSPDYNHQGELHTTDENGTLLVILCYVQEKPIMGHDTFILLYNNTIVDCKPVRCRCSALASKAACIARLEKSGYGGSSSLLSTTASV